MGAKRRRLPAEQARAAILDAAERHLAARGPEGIRLKDLAVELGISHPTILHHFGSRAGLVRAVAQRAVRSLENDLVAVIAGGDVDEQAATGLFERVLEVLGERRHARTLAWLLLARTDETEDVLDYGAQLGRLAAVVHQNRTAHLGDRTPEYQDTLFAVMLASLALFGHAIANPMLSTHAGVNPREFLHWLTRLLLRYLDCSITGPV
ncbi:MAG TPA: TetR/AcrR family transcriptional regulator [Kofleriaceae bacterium]|nr:TetR/AcrR family transcriptional regulator [Kofleriaceae bacterium]